MTHTFTLTYPLPFQEHEPGSETEIQALTVTAFIKKLYTSADIFPEFADYVQQQEFIDALASSLFPAFRECSDTSLA